MNGKIHANRFNFIEWTTATATTTQHTKRLERFRESNMIESQFPRKSTTVFFFLFLLFSLVFYLLLCLSVYFSFFLFFSTLFFRFFSFFYSFSDSFFSHSLLTFLDRIAIKFSPNLKTNRTVWKKYTHYYKIGFSTRTSHFDYESVFFFRSQSVHS